jgi:hypothetical protein
MWPGAIMDSEYEALRARNIARNAEELDRLGLQKLIEKRPSAPRQPRQRKTPREPTRESRRTRSLPTPAYTPGMHEAMVAEARTVAVDEGRRLPDGSWSGERFGAVAGVEVGHVFGAGDYQRLGRQEMMDSGFFRPFVTPEWNAPGEGCFAVILNNDNGASTDEGDRIFYAGSGGRRRVDPQWLDTEHICVRPPTVYAETLHAHERVCPWVNRRGQNRTAPQSFDQDWQNLTNAALRQNGATGEPVRVIRGPKLQGGHGTGESGGGYRYDGLYTVEKAALVQSHNTRFKTAMFTLVRRQ